MAGSGMTGKRFKVWVEVEEVDDDGDTVDAGHSLSLDGAALLETDDLNAAVKYGNILQSMAIGKQDVALYDVVPMLDGLTKEVSAYQVWMDENADDQGDPLGNLADYDEGRTDWWEALSLSAVLIGDQWKALNAKGDSNE